MSPAPTSASWSNGASPYVCDGIGWKVEQDREMLTNIPSDAHKREMLYQHDVGVARMRRTLTQQAKQQLEAEVAASTRAAG